MEKRERNDFDSDAEGTWQQTEPALLHEKWSRWSQESYNIAPDFHSYCLCCSVFTIREKKKKTKQAKKIYIIETFLLSCLFVLRFVCLQVSVTDVSQRCTGSHKTNTSANLSKPTGRKVLGDGTD